MVDLIGVIMVNLTICLLVYVLGVIVAKKLYNLYEFTEDREVILWSWIGVIVILLSSKI